MVKNVIDFIVLIDLLHTEEIVIYAFLITYMSKDINLNLLINL